MNRYFDYGDDDYRSRERISMSLGLSVGLVRRLERHALIKVRIGLQVIELLGEHRAEAVLESLRRRPLADWYAALAGARSASRRRSP
jgi:hypothetical protein